MEGPTLGDAYFQTASFQECGALDLLFQAAGQNTQMGVHAESCQAGRGLRPATTKTSLPHRMAGAQQGVQARNELVGLALPPRWAAQRHVRGEGPSWGPRWVKPRPTQGACSLMHPWAGVVHPHPQPPACSPWPQALLSGGQRLRQAGSPSLGVVEGGGAWIATVMGSHLPQGHTLSLLLVAAGPVRTSSFMLLEEFNSLRL